MQSLIVDQINAEGLAVTRPDSEGNAVPFVESKKIMQPFGDRSGVVIEQMLTDQWFADAATLAQPAIASVREGRTVHDNIRKVTAWTIPTNVGEALAIIAAILFGLTLPMTPVQILWINMILTVTLGRTSPSSFTVP